MSPLIWRHVVVAESVSLAALHEVLQVVFGWSGERRHESGVHGRAFDGDADRDAAATLCRLGLRLGGRFEYGYDFIDGWLIDVGVDS